jgi:hypothetical protein
MTKPSTPNTPGGTVAALDAAWCAIHNHAVLPLQVGPVCANNIYDSDESKIGRTYDPDVSQALVLIVNKLPAVLRVLETAQKWDDSKGLANILVAQEALSDALSELEKGTPDD